MQAKPASLAALGSDTRVKMRPREGFLEISRAGLNTRKAFSAMTMLPLLLVLSRKPANARTLQWLSRRQQCACPTEMITEQ